MFHNEFSPSKFRLNSQSRGICSLFFKKHIAKDG